MSQDIIRPRTTPIRKRLAWVLRAGVCAILAIIVYHAGWGRLMPLLPWAPGFERQESSRAVIFYHPDMRVSALEIARIVDSLVPLVEDFHGLAFRMRPEVVAAGSEAEYRRLSGGSARFRALPVRGRIFISPRAVSQNERKEIHLDTYLQHEFSHALLYQQMGWSGLLGLPRWFEEGLATLSANQMGVDGYFDRQHVLSWWRQGRIVPPSQYDSHFRDSKATIALPDGERFLFLYSQYAVMIDDLIARDGRSKFQNLLDRVLRGEDMDDAFRTEYGTNPDSCFQDLVARSVSGDR